jgi:predicted alpha/beta-fold hydrolase
LFNSIFTPLYQSTRIYNGARTEDLEEIIEWLYRDLACDKQGNQTRRLVGVGISLGASVLGLYAARTGDKNPLDACFCTGCNYNC